MNHDDLTRILQIAVFPYILEAESVVIFALSTPAWQAVWGKVTLFAYHLPLEVCMEQHSVGNSSTAASGSRSVPHREGRGVWVLTAYGISGLALFGILVYYFSTYVTH